MTHTRRAAIGLLGLALPLAGLASYPLLLLDVDARGAARGGSALADAHGLEAVHGNPSALAGLEGESLAMLYVDHLQDLKVVGTHWATDRVAGWKLGLAALHLDYGQLEGLDGQGDPTGDFTAGSTVLKASVARRLPDQAGGRLEAGLSAGWAQESIDEASSSALLLDAGLSWRRGQLSLGAAARNVGVVLSDLGSSADELPRSWEAGAAWRLAHLPFTWSLSWQAIQDRDPFLKLGGEFRLGERWRLGLGYQVERGDDRLGGVSGEGTRGFTAGVGGRLPQGFELAWAWGSLGELGSLNQLSLSWRYR
jgi:hypothetical protein